MRLKASCRIAKSKGDNVEAAGPESPTFEEFTGFAVTENDADTPTEPNEDSDNVSVMSSPTKKGTVNAKARVLVFGTGKSTKPPLYTDDGYRAKGRVPDAKITGGPALLSPIKLSTNSSVGAINWPEAEHEQPAQRPRVRTAKDSGEKKKTSISASKMKSLKKLSISTAKSRKAKAKSSLMSDVIEAANEAKTSGRDHKSDSESDDKEETMDSDDVPFGQLQNKKRARGAVTSESEAEAEPAHHSQKRPALSGSGRSTKSNTKGGNVVSALSKVQAAKKKAKEVPQEPTNAADEEMEERGEVKLTAKKPRAYAGAAEDLVGKTDTRIAKRSKAKVNATPVGNDDMEAQDDDVVPKAKVASASEPEDEESTAESAEESGAESGGEEAPVSDAVAQMSNAQSVCEVTKQELWDRNLQGTYDHLHALRTVTMVSRYLVTRYTFSAVLEKEKYGPLTFFRLKRMVTWVEDLGINFFNAARSQLAGLTMRPINHQGSATANFALMRGEIPAVFYTLGYVHYSNLVKPRNINPRETPGRHIREIAIMPLSQEWERTAAALGAACGDLNLKMFTGLNSSIKFSTAIGELNAGADRRVASQPTLNLQAMHGASSVVAANSRIDPMIRRHTLGVNSTIPIWDCTEHFTRKSDGSHMDEFHPTEVISQHPTRDQLLMEDPPANSFVGIVYTVSKFELTKGGGMYLGLNISGVQILARPLPNQPAMDDAREEAVYPSQDTKPSSSSKKPSSSSKKSSSSSKKLSSSSKKASKA
ncbi:hypothetical protein BV25DRAFT_1843691 [Artomyces pyxidatus]|uniref:Uncharacterized protein n=1 Tax=Artomyces pyxidatus TaxID=48021 RepID=A0ACB8SEL2_9AGAM|nr:hypothetical protein BV25DRAFT_1843691 [Artomyces pyxidatus]